MVASLLLSVGAGAVQEPLGALLLVTELLLAGYYTVTSLSLAVLLGFVANSSIPEVVWHATDSSAVWFRRTF
jgi:hypothetical protein